MSHVLALLFWLVVGKRVSALFVLVIAPVVFPSKVSYAGGYGSGGVGNALGLVAVVCIMIGVVRTVVGFDCVTWGSWSGCARWQD